jgi:nucleotide-binding universal stress UspA family protein
MFERILLAVDGSDHSKKAVPVAGDLCRRYGGEVIVLHVREHEVTWGADIDVETAEEARSLVDGVVRELKDAGANVRGEVVRVPLGQIARAILDMTREEGAGLIVMGSVAHKVVHLAEVPVLVVR